MRTCYHCAKLIKGQMRLIVPPNFAIAMGDCIRAYHPRCYVVAEQKAAAELTKKGGVA